MIQVFEDDLNKPGSHHARFQSWRAQEPEGFVLNVRSSTESILHRTPCTHFGDTSWQCEPDGANSLTQRRKVCSVSANELVEYALNQYSARPTMCESCKPAADTAANARAELTASADVEGPAILGRETSSRAVRTWRGLRPGRVEGNTLKRAATFTSFLDGSRIVAGVEAPRRTSAFSTGTLTSGVAIHLNANPSSGRSV